MAAIGVNEMGAPPEPRALGNPGDENWTAFPAGPEGLVTALAVDSTGNLYVGGKFAKAGGLPVNNIARWNGSSWSALCNGAACGTNEEVRALVIDDNNDLYAGGKFTTAGGVRVNGIARWNGTSWAGLGTGMSSPVFALARDGAGSIYAGGWFEKAGGVGVNYVAHWNGASWSGLCKGVNCGTNGMVYALAVEPAGGLFVGGQFTTAGGVTVNQIAQWNGSTWVALGSGMNMGSMVVALVVGPDGALYAGGGQKTAGGVTVNYIAKWDGSTWSALCNGAQCGMGSVTVVALAFDGAGNLYAAGSFTTAGGLKVNRIAKWNGVAWSALGSGFPGLSGYQAMALVFRDGTLYAGGTFPLAGNLPAPYLAAWTAADGRHTLNPNSDYVLYKDNLPVRIHTTAAMGDLARVNIQRFNRSHPNASGAAEGLGTRTGYYWQLEGLNAAGAPATGYSVDLTLPASGFVPDGRDAVCTLTGVDNTWDCVAGSHDGASITRHSVSFSSVWAAGNDVLASPTATPTATPTLSPTPTVTRTPTPTATLTATPSFPRLFMPLMLHGDQP